MTNNPKKRFILPVSTVIFVLAVAFFTLAKGHFIWSMIPLGYSYETAVHYYLFLSSVTVFALFNTLVLINMYAANANARSMLLVALATFGAVYVFCLTPFSPPDEHTHYIAAYRVSNRLLCLPNAEADSALLNISVFSVHNNTFNSLLQAINLMVEPFAKGTAVSIAAGGNLSHDYPLEYLFPALGFTIARLLKFNFIWTFYSGRICAFLFYCGCVAIAIKRTQKHMLLFGIVALLPMSLQQAVSYSYDSFINGISMVLFSSLFYAATEAETIKIKDWLYIIIPAILVAPAKGVFGFIILPAVIIMGLLVPASKFQKGVVEKIIFVVIAAILIVFSFMLFKTPKTMGNVFESPLVVETEILSVENSTLARLLGDPVDVFRVFIRTFNYSFSQWIGQAIGSVLSGLSLSVPSWIVLGFSAVLMLAAIRPAADNNSYKLFGIGSFLAFLSSMLVVMAALFLTWTSAGADSISGIQGRYFLPVFPLLLVSAKVVPVRANLHNERVLILFATVLQLMTITFVFAFTINLI